jgi:hypothetical protein
MIIFLALMFLVAVTIGTYVARDVASAFRRS